jgi:hypothetical protein
VEIKAVYAGSLCAVGRFVEAGRLLDAVLEISLRAIFHVDLAATEENTALVDTTKNDGLMMGSDITVTGAVGKGLPAPSGCPRKSATPKQS